MKCKKGKHTLILLLDQSDDSPKMYPAVRWCECCGAVVIDGDVDNRMMRPGAYMEMRFPQVIN